MFKKFKDKLAEEMKQSPARLQASMHQLAQVTQAVSPSLSNVSIPEQLSTSNDNFSLTDDIDTSITNMSNTMGLSRTSSINSVADTSGLNFPVFTNFGSTYHLQSDFEQSASEIDESVPSQLDQVSKDQIYSAYRKAQTKYHKYRGRYTDLAKHYKDMERIKNKLESLLVETQDKALRRISDLKEQCQMEQQAKAHLEEALRNDIEEKDHVINTLNTKVKLLKNNDVVDDNNDDDGDDDRVNQNKSSNSTLDDNSTNLIALETQSQLLIENTQLKSKLEKVEAIISKYKESLKRSKDKIGELNDEKSLLERDINLLKDSFDNKVKELNENLDKVNQDNVYLNEQINIMKKREEESVISLAENKLFIHRELEIKEEQIKQLNLELKQAKENQHSGDKDRLQSIDLLTAEKSLNNLINFDESNNSDGKMVSNEELSVMNRCLELENQLKANEEIISNLMDTVKANESIINDLKDNKKNLIKNVNKFIRNVKFDCVNMKEDFKKYENHRVNELNNIREMIINNLNNYNLTNTKLNNEKINELCSKINTLENNLSNKNLIEDELKEKAVELKKLKNYNNKLIAENENNNFKIFDINKKYQDTVNSMKDIQKEFDAFRDKYSNQEINKSLEENIQVKNLQLKLDELHQEMEKSSEEYNKKLLVLAHENDSYKVNLEEYMQKLNELTKENSDLKTDSKIHLEEIKNFEEKQSKLEELNASLEKEKTQLILDLNQQNESVKTLMEEKDHVRLELIEQIEKLKVLIEEKDQMSLELSNKVESLKNLIEEKNQTNLDLNNQIMSFKNVNEEKEQMRLDLNQQIENLNKLKEEKDQLTLNLNDQVESLNKLVEEKNKLISDSNNQIEYLKKVNEQLETDNLSKMEKLIAEKDQLHLDLNNKIKKLEEESLDNVNILEEAEKNRVLKEKLELEKTTLIEELENYKESSKNTFKSQNEENDKLLKKLHELEEEKEGIVSNNKQLNEANNELARYNDELQKSEEVLREKVEELESLLQNTSKKITNLTEELDKFKEMVKFQKETEEISKSKDELIRELKESQVSHENIIDGLKKELEVSKSINKDCDCSLENLKIMIIDLKGKIDEKETKEIQLKNLNEELNDEVNKLKEELKTFEGEQNIRINQLVKEFQAQLNDKNEELDAALGKKFDRQQTYESELIHQYKEQLKDFQIELTSKSEEIESLKNHKCTNNFTEEEKKYLETISSIKIKHENDLKQMESKWKEKTEELQLKHETVVNELNKQWKKNQTTEDNSTDKPEDIENMSRIAMTAVHSNTGSFQSLQKTLMSQRRELVELRKLVNLRHETLEDSTEIEYLRNILYEYMMGKETLVLARVIAAVVKFNDEQTSKIIKKEEDKLTLLGSLGL